MKCGPYSNDHNLIRRLYFTYNETPNLPGLNSLGGSSFSFDYHALMRVIVATLTNELSGQFNVKTGVIGLGARGSGMALNLHKAGHLHSIWNRTASKAETIANSAGVSAGDEDISSLCRLKRHS